jgi:hypothetical protein
LNLKKILLILVATVITIDFTFNSNKSDASINVFADDNLNVDTSYLGSQRYRYPFDGHEHATDPEECFYYIDYYDANGDFVKTQRIRVADDFCMVEIYPDLPKKYFEYQPISQEDYDAYCETYGYIPPEGGRKTTEMMNEEKNKPTATPKPKATPTPKITSKPKVTVKPTVKPTPKPQATPTSKPAAVNNNQTSKINTPIPTKKPEPTPTNVPKVSTPTPTVEQTQEDADKDSTLPEGAEEGSTLTLEQQKDLFLKINKEGLTKCFYDTVKKIGTRWGISDDVVTLLNAVSEGVINSSDLTANDFNSSEIEDEVKTMMMAVDDNIFEVFILPYKSNDYPEGTFFYYRDVKEHPIIVLFHNDMSLTEQFDKQLELIF